uniref:Uncharacterized protein n=1 Tax=Anguilla anguilla TaxID=7936 RepID=A0A0E9XLG0_ANGAN
MVARGTTSAGAWKTSQSRRRSCLTPSQTGIPESPSRLPQLGPLVPCRMRDA